MSTTWHLYAFPNGQTLMTEEDLIDLPRVASGTEEECEEAASRLGGAERPEALQEDARASIPAPTCTVSMPGGLNAESEQPTTSPPFRDARARDR